MIVFALVLALIFQATPQPSMPPPPPPPTPIPTATPQSAPQATPLASPGASPSVLAASVTAVNLQPGQSLTISISNSSGMIAASIDNSIATVSVDQSASTVTVTASQRTGHATLSVGDEAGQTLTIPVHVAFPAATIPSQINLRITGTSVDAAWLQTQVQRAIAHAMSLQPGVPAQNVQLSQYELPPSLAPGANAAIPLTVRVAGGDQYLDTNAAATISLQNVSVAPFAPPYLFYDDDPEKITDFGVLYRGQVSSGRPGRLYYYHQNENLARRVLVLLTATNRPVTVQLIDASAGPNIDVMSVGHAVSRDFLVRKPANEGIVVDVVPGTPYAVDDFAAIRPVEGVAGTIGINVLSGDSVTVTVLSVPTTATASDIAAALNAPPLPGDGHHRTGVFDITAFGQASMHYSVGQEDDPVQYGAATPPNAPSSASGHDYGEYGVLRTVAVAVTNSQPHDQTLYLYERPLGGVVRSSFLVNGQLIEVGCTRVPNRYQIGQPFSVAPGSTSQLQVQTMTDGGSNYPLEFGITATPPLPTTPPMSAPDGCFPKPQPAATPNASPSPSATVLPSPSPSP